MRCTKRIVDAFDDGLIEFSVAAFGDEFDLFTEFT